MTIEQLLYQQYINKISRSNTSIGVEVELPLISTTQKAVELSFVASLCQYAMQLGFSPCKRTTDGYICEMIDKTANILSFETTWNTLELSIKNQKDLVSLAAMLYGLLIPLQQFCVQNGYLLCGLGINPNYAFIDMAPLKTKALQAKSQYLEIFTKHHDGEVFHALSAAVQTHLDALDVPSFLRLFRLLRKAYVFDGLFFANSLPPEEAFITAHAALNALARDTLCYRDELWRYCGAPNTSQIPEKLNHAEEFCQYLQQLKLFVLQRGEEFIPIAPIALADYCADSTWDEKALTCFRSLEPVAPTRNGSLEIRSTCVQPLDALLEPPAFYAGLAANIQQAEAVVDTIYRHFFPGDTPPQVRDKLMKKSNEPLRQALKADGIALLDVAVKGLTRRGFGEECLLQPLKNRYERETFQTPAQHTETAVFPQTMAQIEHIERMLKHVN